MVIVSPYLGTAPPSPRATDVGPRRSVFFAGSGVARVRGGVDGIEKAVAPRRLAGEPPPPRPVSPRRPKAAKPTAKAPGGTVEIFLPGEEIPGLAADQGAVVGRPASLVAPPAGTPLAAYGSAAGLRHDATARGRFFDISA